MKKIFAILLTLSLMAALVCISSVSASAQEVHTITFDVQGIGDTPDPVQIADGEKYLYLGRENVPHADGYVFHCWVTTLDFEPDEVAMSNTAGYLETPVTEDMTLYAIWYKLVDSVDVVLDPPVAGDVIGTRTYETEDYSFDYQYPQPHPSVTSEGAQVQDNFWSALDLNAFWLEDPNDHESVFKGTFESGKTYGVDIVVEPKFGYEFTDQVSVTFNGKPVESFICSGFDMAEFSAPIVCGNAPAPAETPTSAVRATKDSATPDSKTASGSNPYAVKTGELYPVVLIVLMGMAAVATVIVARRKKQ